MKACTRLAAPARPDAWPRAPRNARDLVAFVPLIRSIVADVVRSADLDHAGIEARDLVGCGTVGLLRAAERFDPYRGIAFSTFASRRIRGAMLDAIRTDALWRRDANRIASDAEQLVADADALETCADVALRLARAVRRLPPCDAALVHGRFVEERSLAELGRRIDRSPSQVCRRLASAISRIREPANLTA